MDNQNFFYKKNKHSFSIHITIFIYLCHSQKVRIELHHHIQKIHRVKAIFALPTTRKATNEKIIIYIFATLYLTVALSPKDDTGLASTNTEANHRCQSTDETPHQPDRHLT